MQIDKEKIILENILSSKDVFSRCSGIIKSHYFSLEYRNVTKFIMEYYDKYHSIPDPDIVKAETGIQLNKRNITTDIYNYTCDNIETFCRESAMKEAIIMAADELSKPENNMGKIYEAIKNALYISLPKDTGMEFFENPEEKLKSFLENHQYISTGYKNLDHFLGGGLVRKQFTLFSANSGGGKSIMLANLGANLAKAGYNVLYLSLELQESMIFLRLASIVSGISTRVWKQEIPNISYKIEETKKKGAGSYILKRIPIGSTANDIRAFIKLYELTNGFAPDILLIDYLDIMHPNEGTKNLSISEQDKLKSEQMVEVLNEYNCVGISASQQNREAIKSTAPDQSHIAGGLTKVNTVDNYISIYMTPQMRLEGYMMLFFLKTRSSDGVGNNMVLGFDPNTLLISNSNKTPPSIQPPITTNSSQSDKKNKSKADEILASMKKNDIIANEEENTKVFDDKLADFLSKL